MTLSARHFAVIASLVLAVIETAAGAMPAEYYEQQKGLLLLDISQGGFLHKRFLVERSMENGVAPPAGIGDAAWRTGLAAICFAIEGDEVNTCDFLDRLNSAGWQADGPIRHPYWFAEERKKLQSTEATPMQIGSKLLVKRCARDQLMPQLAACHSASRYGDEAA